MKRLLSAIVFLAMSLVSLMYMHDIQPGEMENGNIEMRNHQSR